MKLILKVDGFGFWCGRKEGQRRDSIESNESLTYAIELLKRRSCNLSLEPVDILSLFLGEHLSGRAKN